MGKQYEVEEKYNKIKSCFEYVKGTELNNDYEYFINIENVYRKETYDDCAALIRKETEKILKRIVIKHNLKDEIIKVSGEFKYETIKQYLCSYSNAKLNAKGIQQQISNIQRIGNKGVHIENGNRISKTDITNALQNLHEICVWYLKYISKEINIYERIPFINPINIEDEVTIIKKDNDKLNRTIEEKENIIKENEAELKKKNIKIEESTKQINDLEKELDFQKNEFLKKERKLNLILENESNNIKSELRIKEETIEQLESEKKIIENESINISTEFEQYKNENVQKITKISNELDAKKKIIKHMNKSLEIHKNEKKKLMNDKEKLEAIIKRKDTEIKNYKEEINRTNDISIENESVNISREFEQYKSKNVQKITKIINELYDEKKIIKEMKKSLETHKNEKRKLINEKEKLEKIISRKDKEIQEYREEMNRTNGIINELDAKKKIIKDMDKSLEAHKNEKEKLEKIINRKDKEIEEYRKEMNRTNGIIVEKENALIYSEKQMEMLKKCLNEVEDKVSRELNENEELKKKVKISQEKFDNVEQNYELLLEENYKLNTKIKEYQQMLEERNNEDNIKKRDILTKDIKHSREDIQKQEESFDKCNEKSKKLGYESETDLKSLVKIVNEKTSLGKYEDFYKGFLGISGRNLRNIYVLLTQINMTSVLVNKTKESFSESESDFMSEYLLKKSKELDDENDDIIRLNVYYELIRKTESTYGGMISANEFIKNIDEVIEKSYYMVCNNNNFIIGNSKLEDISLYYLNQVIENIKSKYERVEAYISDEIAERIYEEIWRLDVNTKNIIYNELNINKHNITEIKREIINNPFIVLNSIINKRDDNTFYIVSKIMEEICKLFNFNSGVFTNVSSLSNMFNEFIMNIFGNSKSELAPLCIMQVMLYTIDMKNEKTDLSKYTAMLKIWFDEKNKYNEIKKDYINNQKMLNEVNNEKNININTLNKAEKALNTLSHERIEKYDIFSNNVFYNEKAKFLPSYDKYKKLLQEEEESKSNIEKVKQEKGFMKSLFNKEMWKEQSSKIINGFNIKNIEKNLIIEAEQSPHFKKEFSVILDIDDKIEKINKLKNELQNKIQNNNRLIEEINRKIYTNKNILDNISKRFPDF